MRKLLALLILVLCVPVGFAMAGPAEDLATAVQFAREKNKAAATPLLDGIIADETVPANMKAQAYFVYAALESDPAAQIPYLDKAIAADPGFFRGHERKALRLFEMGKFAEAAETADGALNLQPGSAGVLTLKAKSLFSAGDYVRSAETAAAALEVEPGNKEMMQHKADSYYNVGDYANAAAAFSDCLQADNRNGKLYLFRGHSYLLSHQQEKALADFNTAQRYISQLTAQEQNDIHYYRGMAYQDTNRFDLAVGSFNKALQMNPAEDRKADLERLIAEVADKKAAYEASALTRKELDRAESFLKRKNFRDATAILLKILENQNVPDDLKARTFYYLSFTGQSAEENLGHSVRAAELALHKAEIWERLGRLRYATENFAAAIEAYDRVLELDATNGPAALFRGRCHLRLGDWAAAERDCNKSLELGVEEFICLPNRARAHFMRGNVEQARADILKARPNVSRLEKSDAAEFYFVSGLLAQHDKKYSDALEFYDRALRSDASGARGKDMQHRKQQLESLRRWS